MAEVVPVLVDSLERRDVDAAGAAEGDQASRVGAEGEGEGFRGRDDGIPRLL